MNTSMKQKLTERESRLVGAEGERAGRGEDWEVGIQRNNKQQRPTVEHKEIY